jgi:DNA polymerase-3 subunit gamma/tau
MFDNILHQETIKQLRADINGGILAQALLFSGPQASGKGSAALELARVLSCESEADPGSWNCLCPGCVRHRSLVSQDLLLLGQKPFFADISACARAFRREPESSGVKRLFIRSVRKLLGRFSPVLWEDDPKLGKISGLIADLEEDLEAFERKAGDEDKTVESLLKNSMKLESGGMGEFIPIAQIRRAAYWSRLAPAGKHKCVIIENAERMQDGAKNSLLKILEEPPERVTLILTCSRPGTLLPTIRSRLRRYRFAGRSHEEEIDVIRRIFRDKDYTPEPRLPAGAAPGYETAPKSGPPEPWRDTGIIAAYLESFLPVDNRSLYSLGAYFVASIAAAAVRECKAGGRAAGRAGGRAPPGAVVELGKFAVPAAEEFGRPAPDIRTTLFTVGKHTDNFEIPGLFARFCKNILFLLSAFLRGGGSGVEKTELVRIWKRELDAAFNASDTYNIKETLVMERLAETLANVMADAV